MGRDKALLEIDGEPLVDRVADRLRAAGATTVLLASGTPGRLDPRPHQVFDDPACGPHPGPLAGIVAALTRANTIGADLLLVAAVDLPNADPALFRWLVDQWRPDDTALVPVDRAGRPQPLHSLLSSVPHVALKSAMDAGERRVMHALDAIEARYIDAPTTAAENWSENWNRPHPGWG